MFYGADGQPWFRLDEQRHDVPLDEIAADLQHAVVAVEDRRFYHHPGIDPIGLGRAVVRDVRGGGARRRRQHADAAAGAHAVPLERRRPSAARSKKAGIALLIEAQLSKKQILELYLNRVYLSAGVYGVETMSEHLFRKPASAVTLPEAALIAGLIRAPSALSPWSNYDGALERSHIVLALMRAQGFITAAQEAAARASRPRIQPYRQPSDARAGWAKDYPAAAVPQRVRRRPSARLAGAHRVPAGGAGRRRARRRRPACDRLASARPRGGAGRDRSARPATSSRWSAAANYARSTFNRAMRSRRQPGSAFKPLVYAAALAQRLFAGVGAVQPAARVARPAIRSGAAQRREGEQPDALTLRAALLESNNAAAARSAAADRHARGAAPGRRRRARAICRTCRRWRSAPALVSPLDLTAAYTMFPGGGEVARPRGMISVFDAGGRAGVRPAGRAPAADQPGRRVPDDQHAARRHRARHRRAGARARRPRRRSAGKTGTTDDYHDAWFVGFSTSVVVGVWVGFDQPASIGREAYGARVALPIWADFMKRTARQLPPPDFAVPPGIHGEELCSVSYLAPVDGCPIYTEYFKEGDTVPSELCPIHRGSLKQRASRAIEGFFRGLGGKIAGIFRRK